MTLSIDLPGNADAEFSPAELHRWWDSAVAGVMAENVRPVLLTAEGDLHVRCWSRPHKMLVEEVLPQVVMRQVNRHSPGPRVRSLAVWLTPFRVLVAGSPTWHEDRLAELLVDVLQDTWHDVVQAHGADQAFTVLHGDRFAEQARVPVRRWRSA